MSGMASVPSLEVYDRLDACGRRGMNFLYSLNRLNVATSRARALSVLMCSPTLFEPECKMPEQMRMANAFRRYLEMTATVNA
jgi:superfamily I DNA and/or RNA helicase